MTPKLTSSHGQIEYTAAYRTIPSERNLESSLATLTHQVNEKKPTLEWVGEAETLSHHKPHLAQ